MINFSWRDPPKSNRIDILEIVALNANAFFGLINSPGLRDGNIKRGDVGIRTWIFRSIVSFSTTSPNDQYFQMSRWTFHGLYVVSCWTRRDSGININATDFIRGHSPTRQQRISAPCATDSVSFKKTLSLKYQKKIWVFRYSNTIAKILNILFQTFKVFTGSLHKMN